MPTKVAHNQLSPPRQHPYHPRRRGGAASSPSPPAPLASPQATQPRSPQHNEEEPFLCSRTASPGRLPIAASTPRGEPYSHAARPLGLVSLANTSLSSLASPYLPGEDDACSDAGSVVCLYCEHGGSPLGNEILLCDGQARPRHTTWHTREHTTVAPGRRISRRRQTLNWLGERRTAAPPSSPPRPHTSCLMGSPARPRSTSIALRRRCTMSRSTNGSVPPAFATWRWASGAEHQATVTATNRGWGRAFKWLRHRCLPRARRTSSRPIAAAAA